jgi:hypothetical protein
MDLPDRVSRFLIEDPSGCWSWHGAVRKDGYVVIWLDHRQQMVRRIVYETMRGPLPKRGVSLVPGCPGGADCFNPWHTDPVTKANSMHEWHRNKVECKHGHEEWGINASSGHRRCLRCDRERSRSSS